MIARDDYGYLATLLKQRSGLTLGEDKAYLIESRLPAVAATFGLQDIAALVRAMRASSDDTMVKAVCDAMTTSETQFFRDEAPFRELREGILPAAAARCRAAGRPLRIWSAACSTGQEPYSLAMTVLQVRNALGGVHVEITASDFSGAQLCRARDGVYNHFEVQRGLPVALLVQHFQPVAQGFRVSDELRRMVSFHERNLLQPYTGMPLFDVILCRNVLIYFDVKAKADVLNRLANQLAPDGVVVLGGSETTLGITDALERCGAAGVYGRRTTDVRGPSPSSGRGVPNAA